MYGPRNFISVFGDRLPTLEKNELRRLSIEGSIHSIYADALREMMVDALEQSIERGKVPIPKAKGLSNKLIQLGLISTNLGSDLKSYIEWRNDFAHRLATLMAAFSSNDRFWRVSDFSDDPAPI